MAVEALKARPQATLPNLLKQSAIFRQTAVAPENSDRKKRDYERRHRYQTQCKIAIPPIAHPTVCAVAEKMVEVFGYAENATGL